MPLSKIIVLDDDPTGSQTVHGCLLLTRWHVAALKRGLLDEAPLFFVLSNTRGMNGVDASAITQQICTNLQQALNELAAEGKVINPLLVSRSDSTLRGHYPVETDVIAQMLGPFDAHFLVPAFFEGGRITRDSVHYLMVNGEPVPVHETEFARDSVFGYGHSYLPDYVEEKTAGRIPAGRVTRFLLDDVRGDLRESLLALSGNACCVVDAVQQSDLDHFCHQVLHCTEQGKRFLFRSAASLLTSLARLPPQPVAAEAMYNYVRAAMPGAVLVGSHVRKTTDQLQVLLSMPGIVPIEVDVEQIEDHAQSLHDTIIHRINQVHQQGDTCVIFTSRQEKIFSDQAARLAFGQRVSAFLVGLVPFLPETLGFLISKGGITSNDVLSSGLQLEASRVLGQILPGCSVVQCPDNHPRFAQMPVVIFPGNVGDERALARVWVRLAGRDEAQELSRLAVS